VKQKRFNVEQIVAVFKQVEAVVPELRLAVRLRSRESRIRADSHFSVAPGQGTCPLTSTVSILKVIAARMSQNSV
jgi:hypothetical protein